MKWLTNYVFGKKSTYVSNLSEEEILAELKGRSHFYLYGDAGFSARSPAEIFRAPPKNHPTIWIGALFSPDAEGHSQFSAAVHYFRGYLKKTNDIVYINGIKKFAISHRFFVLSFIFISIVNIVTAFIIYFYTDIYNITGYRFNHLYKTKTIIEFANFIIGICTLGIIIPSWSGSERIDRFMAEVLSAYPADQED